MSKLEFNITEIPEERSERTLQLDEQDIDIGDETFKGGVIDIVFYRTLHFIRVNYSVDAEVELVCDRSLEPFRHAIRSDYEVIFKVDVHEETEDENGAVRRFNFNSNTLSIEQEVRDTILLNIPIKKLHPKFYNEYGNPEGFETKSFGKPSGEESDTIDPRWAKLKALKNKK